MTSETAKLKISTQRERVFGVQPELKLSAPCKTGDGILKLSKEDSDRFRAIFEKAGIDFGFFTPASGSGSRMFQFLFDFLSNADEESRSLLERFLNHLPEFAFYKELPVPIREKIENDELDLEELIQFLLSDNGMAYSEIAKALIPFHKYGPFILNPLQEHILQGSVLAKSSPLFHFTIQDSFEKSMSEKIESMKGITGSDYKVEFSTQDPESNAIAFYPNGEAVLLDNGDCLQRPAGHGALLQNLNEMDSRIIFIRNIDNVQHYSKTENINGTWNLLGGISLAFQEDLKNLMANISLQNLKILNDKYHLFLNEEINETNYRALAQSLNRPTRVCGMVKNEGQAGGGPFWVEENGVNTKQIVEKAQISKNPDQFKIMVQSTHFNPVLIAINAYDFNGNKFDLREFADESQFFVVHKKYKGQDIRFYELPGLWNGSMANWNTIFVEVSTSNFSPVKNILDLLEPNHLETVI